MTLDLCASTRDWIARSPSRHEIQDFADWLKAQHYTDLSVIAICGGFCCCCHDCRRTAAFDRIRPHSSIGFLTRSVTWKPTDSTHQ
jgi:hypothetical protein